MISKKMLRKIIKNSRKKYTKKAFKKCLIEWCEYLAGSEEDVDFILSGTFQGWAKKFRIDLYSIKYQILKARDKRQKGI